MQNKRAKRMRKFIIYVYEKLKRCYKLLKLNKEGMPFARLMGGKHNNQSVSVLKKFHLFESKCTRGVISDVKKLIN